MFAFIDTQRTRFSVVSLCRRYHVTTPGFYAWLGRDESAHAKQDRVLTTEISRLFALHKERSGSPRIHQALGLAGWCVSRRRVAHLVRVAGLRAKAVQGYRAKANIHQLYARHPIGPRRSPARSSRSRPQVVQRTGRSSTAPGSDLGPRARARHPSIHRASQR